MVKKKSWEVIVMKEKISKVIAKMKKQNWSILALNAMALVMVIHNVNVTCAWLEHQPEVPEAAKRFKKL